MDRELNKQLSEVSESIVCKNSKIRNVTKGIEDFHHIFHDNKRLFLDLKNTWQKGNMNMIIQDIDVEINRHQQKLFNSLDDEKHKLNNHINTLEEKQFKLVSKQKTFEGD